MPRKNPKSDPVDAITERVMELTQHIHAAKDKIKELKLELCGHMGPPGDVLGIMDKIVAVNRDIEVQERIAREAQVVVEHSRKTLRELETSKASTEAQIIVLEATIQKDQNALKSIVRDNLTPKTPGA